MRRQAERIQVAAPGGWSRVHPMIPCAAQNKAGRTLIGASTRRVDLGFSAMWTKLEPEARGKIQNTALVLREMLGFRS